ncbi:hypothetical protein OAS86_02760 [Gammaproteobacteria bacterium]|nr:hypothetical protein [Gammaproteobacteria bacterium]
MAAASIKSLARVRRDDRDVFVDLSATEIGVTKKFERDPNPIIS